MQRNPLRTEAAFRYGTCQRPPRLELRLPRFSWRLVTLQSPSPARLSAPLPCRPRCTARVSPPSGPAARTREGNARANCGAPAHSLAASPARAAAAAASPASPAGLEQTYSEGKSPRGAGVGAQLSIHPLHPLCGPAAPATAAHQDPRRAPRTRQAAATASSAARPRSRFDSQLARCFPFYSPFLRRVADRPLAHPRSLSSALS